MRNESLNRRSFLKTMSSAGMLAALPEVAFGAPNGNIIHEVAEPGQNADAKPVFARRVVLVQEAKPGKSGDVAVRRTAGQAEPLRQFTDPERRTIRGKRT